MMFSYVALSSSICEQEIFVIEEMISATKEPEMSVKCIFQVIQSGTKLWVTSPFRPTLGHPSTPTPWKTSLSSEQIRLWSLWRFSLASWFPLGIWPLSAPNSCPEHQNLSFQKALMSNILIARGLEKMSMRF